VKFQAYDTWRGITHGRSKTKVMVILDEPVRDLDGEITMGERLAAPEVEETIEERLAKVRHDADLYLDDDKERQVILLASAGLTLEEIAELWGMTPSRASQVMAKAAEHLRARTG
jgi:DNA-directed RNA polymerase specialized sigma subunit